MMTIYSPESVQVRGADGTILYSAGQQIGAYYYVKNADVDTANPGEAVLWSNTGAQIPVCVNLAAGTPQPSYIPQQTQLCFRRNPATAPVGNEVGYIGVLMDETQPGSTGLVAGPGSICSVRMFSGGSLLPGPGRHIGSYAPAVGTDAANRGNSVFITRGFNGNAVGFSLRRNIIGADGTGSQSWAGVMVAPK